MTSISVRNPYAPTLNPVSRGAAPAAPQPVQAAEAPEAARPGRKAALLACAGLSLLGAGMPAVAQAMPQVSLSQQVQNACTPGYRYAGIQTQQSVSGIEATLVALKNPTVTDGHVAAWVGVGGPDEGARGQDAWIQVGINKVASGGNHLYAEAWIPGYGQAYKDLGPVRVGQKVRVAVREVPGQPGVWRAWVDGKPVSKPVFLPGSHGRWNADAVSENWSPAGACNHYAYGFQNVRYARQGGSWAPVRDRATLEDPGTHLTRPRGNSFVATA